MKVEVFINDGTAVKPGDVAMTVEGKIQSLLQTERLMLNIMQRMSGIATPICEKAKEQFLAYFDGRLKKFSLPYDISGIGTPFFRSLLTAVQLSLIHI